MTERQPEVRHLERVLFDYKRNKDDFFGLIVLDILFIVIFLMPNYAFDYGLLVYTKIFIEKS